MPVITLDGRPIGTGHRPYVIAEIGANHNGDMELCRRMIDAAAESGADAVKFQSWSEESLISTSEYEANAEYSDKKKHFGSLRDMVRAYQLTHEQHFEAARYCAERGITFCSTPFGRDEVDLLVELNVPFFKVASMDITNLPLLRYIASKGKAVILSTGMASLAEVAVAVEAVREVGDVDIMLLHCVSIYPPDMEDVNLNNIPMLEQAFGVPVGFSDHTLGAHIPIASIALGACLIEKHFTLDKTMEGWDHAISADEVEMRMIVEHGQEVHRALGSSQRIVSEAELAKRAKFRRSAVAARPLDPGHILEETDIAFKRPGTGYGPDQIENLLGRSLAVALSKDDIIGSSHLI